MKFIVLSVCSLFSTAIQYETKTFWDKEPMFVCGQSSIMKEHKTKDCAVVRYSRTRASLQKLVILLVCFASKNQHH